MSTSKEIITKSINGAIYVFDIIRKKYILLTPEEKVRQIFLRFLIYNKKIPLSRIRSEFQLNWNGLRRRCDIVVFDNDIQPIMIVECKKEKQKITESTMDQLARYNLKLKVKYLVATNLITTHYFKLNATETSFDKIDQLPTYIDLV